MATATISKVYWYISGWNGTSSGASPTNVTQGSAVLGTNVNGKNRGLVLQFTSPSTAITNGTLSLKLYLVPYYQGTVLNSTYQSTYNCPSSINVNYSISTTKITMSGGGGSYGADQLSNWPKPTGSGSLAITYNGGYNYCTLTLNGVNTEASKTYYLYLIAPFYSGNGYPIELMGYGTSSNPIVQSSSVTLTSYQPTQTTLGAYNPPGYFNDDNNSGRYGGCSLTLEQVGSYYNYPYVGWPASNTGDGGNFKWYNGWNTTTNAGIGENATRQLDANTSITALYTTLWYTRVGPDYTNKLSSATSFNNTTYTPNKHTEILIPTYVVRLYQGENSFTRINSLQSGAIAAKEYAGYTFYGINTSSSSTTVSTANRAGEGLTVPWLPAYNGAIYYAVYRGKATLKYNANGGSGAPSNTTSGWGYLYGTGSKAAPTATLSSSTPTRFGYEFKGWAKSSTATEAQYAAGSSYTFADTTIGGNSDNSETLYAVWEQKVFTITYNANGGTIPANGLMGQGYTTASGTKATRASDGSSGTTQVTLNTTDFYGIGGDCPTKTGYTFAGWYTAANGGTQVYNSAGLCVAGTYWNSSNQWIYKNNLTVYAHYTANTYRLTFNANGGIIPTGGNMGTPSTQTQYGTGLASDQKSGWVTVTYDGTSFRNMLNDVPTRAGYIFNGWYTAASGGTQVYSNTGAYIHDTAYWTEGGAWKYTNNVTVYAQWVPRVKCWININGTWKLATPYVKVNGTWEQTVPYINLSGTWTT